MPSKAKKVDRDVAKLPSIPKELVELFLSGPMTGEAINEAGIAFKKALIEASLHMRSPPFAMRAKANSPPGNKSRQISTH